MRRKTRHIIFVILFLAGLFSASLFLQEYFYAIQDFIAAYEEDHAILAPIIFIFFAALSVMLGPFTSAPLISFAVALWGTTLTLFLLLIGWIIGNCFAYFIGHSIGYPIVKRLVSKEKIKRWESFLSDTLGVRLLFLFRLATPSEVGYVFGILRYNFSRYMVITILAELPIALLMVFAGEALLGNKWELLVGLIVAGFTIIFSSLYFLRALEKKRGHMHY